MTIPSRRPESLARRRQAHMFTGERRVGASGMVPSELIDVFESIGSVEDVLLMGYVDREHADRPVFQVFPTLAFLQIDNGYLRMDATTFEGQLSLAVADRMDLDVRLLDEPTIEPMVSRVGSLFLSEGFSWRLLTVTCYVDRFSRPDERLVRAAEFHLEYGHSLFVDPAWTFGVRIGASAMAREWLDDGRSPVTTMTWRDRSVG